MKKLLTGAMAALTLATTLTAGATTAQADGWRGRGDYGGYREYRGHGRGYGGGALLGAGILGLAVGAAIAGDRHHDRRYYDGYYGEAPVYYRAPPPAYYNGPYYYSYADECRVSWRWDAYWRRYVEVERCY